MGEEATKVMRAKAKAIKNRDENKTNRKPRKSIFTAGILHWYNARNNYFMGHESFCIMDYRPWTCWLVLHCLSYVEQLSSIR